MKKYTKASTIMSDSKDTHTVTIQTITVEYYEKKIDISDKQYNDLVTFNEEDWAYSKICNYLGDVAEYTDEFPDESDVHYVVRDENGKWLDSSNSLEHLWATVIGWFKRR